MPLSVESTKSSIRMSRCRQALAVEIFYLVVDTNILLHQLDALRQFVVDIEHHLPLTLQIIIPGIVISELDRWVNIVYSIMCINNGWTMGCNHYKTKNARG